MPENDDRLVPLTLHGISVDDALRGALATPPMIAPEPAVIHEYKEPLTVLRILDAMIAKAENKLECIKRIREAFADDPDLRLWLIGQLAAPWPELKRYVP